MIINLKLWDGTYRWVNFDHVTDIEQVQLKDCTQTLVRLVEQPSRPSYLVTEESPKSIVQRAKDGEQLTGLSLSLNDPHIDMRDENMEQLLDD